MSPPVNCHAIRLRYRRRRAPARHRWTLSVHIPLHGVSVYAQFPGDATNGQPLALSLPHRSPSLRLKWCGLPLARTNDLANPPSAVAVGSVARYIDVELRKLVYPASAQAIAVEMRRRSMCGSLGEVARRILGRCGASCVGMICPSCCTANCPSSPSSTSTTAPA